MVNSSRFFSRYDVAILVLFGFLAPILVLFAVRAVDSNKNNVLDWLPPTYRETGELKWFRQHFPGDGFVIVSWEGCRLGGNPADPQAEPDDPRIGRFARALSDQTSRHSLPWFASVTTGRDLLDRMTTGSGAVPYATAVERLRGVLIGPDGRQTCLIVALNDSAVPQFREILGRGGKGIFGRPKPEGELLRVLRECNIDPAGVRLGGPPVDNVAIDEEGERTLVRLAGLACLVGFVLAGIFLRSVKLTLIVFACGVLSSVLSLAAVWLTGQTADAILMSMPALVYVLAISGAVHIVNYYRTEVQLAGERHAPGRALAHAWRPSLFCAVTTALGLLSLYASDLKPIRKFGVYSALGVGLTLLVLFLFLPAALSCFRSDPPVADNRSARRARLIHRLRLTRTADRDAWQEAIARGVCHVLIARHRLVVTACMLFIVTVGWGVTRVRTSIDLMNLFSSDARVLQDYRWLEANVGRLVPLEIVLRFDAVALQAAQQAAGQPAGLDLLARMEIVDGVQRKIEAAFGSGSADVVGPSLSALRFIPPLPQGHRGVRAIARRAGFNQKLTQGYSALTSSGYLDLDSRDGAELWRISLRMAAFKDVDYGRFTDQLRAVVEPELAKLALNQQLHANVGVQVPNRSSPVGKPPAPASSQISAIYTGVVPIVYKAQRALLDSLVQSTVWSFLTITPLLMFVARGIRAGLTAMLPNALPVLTIFGGMGWLGIPVDIGSMMSASIALGVAVDDTIHYLTWFREELVRTGNHRSAIVAAYQRCAAPTLQSALISGLGLSVFAFSTFTPTRQFGFLMLSILIAGVVAELVLLPALLAGPLGVFFASTARRRPLQLKPHWSRLRRVVFASKQP